MDATAMTDHYVGSIHSITLSSVDARFKLRVVHPRQDPQRETYYYSDIRFKTRDLGILHQLYELEDRKLTMLGDDAQVCIYAYPNHASAPGEPYTVTRLTVLSTTPTEP